MLRPNMTLKRKISEAYCMLYQYGEVVNQLTWQSVEAPSPFLEIDNLFFKANMPDIWDDGADFPNDSLSELTKADLPWSEDHFQERISGVPSNPGKEWANWPYYRKEQDDEQFRKNGRFSHTYMERFWAFVYHDDIIKSTENSRDLKNVLGSCNSSRYSTGDYNDIIERAKKDPTSRQLYLSIWHPEDQSNEDESGIVGRRLPCSLGYFFLIRNNKVNLSYFIRSCDIMRHFRNDIYMAIRLAQHFRDSVNEDLEMGEFNMWIGSLHCFEQEKELLRKHF